MFVSESELQNRAFFVIITFSGSDKKGYHHKPLATYILIFFKIINAENKDNWTILNKSKTSLKYQRRGWSILTLNFAQWTDAIEKTVITYWKNIIYGVHLNVPEGY